MSWRPNQPKSTTQVQSLPVFGEVDRSGWVIDTGRTVPLITPMPMKDVSVSNELEPIDLELHRTKTKDLNNREFKFIAGQNIKRIALHRNTKFADLLRRFPVDRIFANVRVSEASNWDNTRVATSRRLRHYEIDFITAPGVTTYSDNEVDTGLVEGCDVPAPEPEPFPTLKVRYSYER